MNSPTLPLPYYENDAVTIYHGDCREILPGLARVDAVITDPPFKLSQAYAANVDADNLEAVASLKDTGSLLLKVVPAGAVAVCFYDNRIMPFALDSMRRAGWQYLRMLAFYRRWGNAHQLSGWMSTTDPVVVFARPGAKPKFYGEWRHDCYIRDKAEPEGFGPAQKPVHVLAHMIENICPAGGTVLDPYMGTGSAAVAAKRVRRRFVGVELEESFCEIAVDRLRQDVLFDEVARNKATGDEPLEVVNSGAEDWVDV